MLLVIGMDAICIIYCILFMIVYYSKRRVKSFDTIYYSILIGLAIVGLIIEILFFISLFKTGKSDNITSVLYLAWYIVLDIGMLFYIYRKSLAFRKVDNDKLAKYSKMYWFIIIPLFIISLVALFMLPSDVVIENGFAYGIGKRILIITIWLVPLYLLSIYFLVRYFKYNSKKQNMFYISILIYGGLLLICRLVAPYIAVSYILLSLIITTQFFTLENPDLEVIEEIKRINSVKQGFLSSMSHEFKTPLNAIVGLSSSPSDNPEEMKNDFSIINEQGLLLIDMVSNVLDINQMDSHNIQLVEADYNVKDLFNNLYNSFTNRFAAKNITFNYSVDESIPDILYGDSGKIINITRNLLSNALKFTNIGSVTLRVSGSISSYIYNLRIEISDTGSGISETDLNNIFNEFAKKEIDINSNINGLGLGLSLCKIITNALNGKISVSSKKGVGSTFVVEVPQIKK